MLFIKEKGKLGGAVDKHRVHWRKRSGECSGFSWAELLLGGEKIFHPSLGKLGGKEPSSHWRCLVVSSCL